MKQEDDREREKETALVLLVRFLSVSIPRRDLTVPPTPSFHQIPTTVAYHPFMCIISLECTLLVATKKSLDSAACLWLALPAGALH